MNLDGGHLLVQCLLMGINRLSLGERKSIRSCGPGCSCVDGNLGINYPGPLNGRWSDVTTHATIFFKLVHNYQIRTANMQTFKLWD
jgi:hypothetical protein